MATDYYYPTSKNAIQKTLAAQLLSTASTGDAITFADVDGIQNKPGVLVINRVDSNGTATPSSREYISYTGTSGTTVLIDTRNVDSSGAARTHAVGSIVEFVADAVWAQRIIDQALVGHNVDGTHKSGSVLTLPQINDTSADHQYVLAVNELTADRTVTLPLLTAADEFVFQAHGLTSSANSNFTYHGLARQAIINGNFDVWQRGTSITAASGEFGPDRWIHDRSGTGATLVISQQTFTVGQTDVPNNPTYFCRVNKTVAGSGETYSQFITRLEGVSQFSGRSCTLSFYAKADTSRTITAQLDQNFGSGGSTGVSTATQNVALTSSWQKFALTFSPASISGKTVGAGNYLSVIFNLPLNATFTFDISEVQLNDGSVALPFMPKSAVEEELACRRYFNRIRGSIYSTVGVGHAFSTTQASINIPVPVKMRTNQPTTTVSSLSHWKLRGNGADVVSTDIETSNGDFDISNAIAAYVTVASGLTSSHCYSLITDNNGTIDLNCEL